MIIEKNTINSEYKKLYDWQKEKIGIPIFQRFYDWKESEIVQLKEDLISILDKPNSELYFLDFIYYEEDDYIKLADGQQRIVTVNNLIKAIKDVAKENNLNIDSIDYFRIKYDINNNQNKYSNHFNNYECSPFKKVYLDLKSFIVTNQNRINDLIDIIKNKIFIFAKKCENADDAFNIFQQINTGGKPLSKDEVIKTAIDQYSQSYGIRFDTSKIKDVKQSLISYYKLKMKNFDKNFDNMEIMKFLKEYVTKDRETFQDFTDTINMLKNLSNSPMRFVINYINRATLLDVLNILAIKHIDIDTNQEYLSKVMIPLCMMSIILTLNGGNPTTFRYLLNEIIVDIKDDVSPNSIRSKLINVINSNPIIWQIKREDFTNKLCDYQTPRSLKKAILIIDIISKNISGTLNVNNINLEHIYPQNPCEEWNNNGWPVNEDERKAIIDNIGNYILLSEKVNKKVQNKYITDKVADYKYIIARDAFLQTEMNTVDYVKFENEQKNYIDSRANEIAKIVQSTFPLGRVLIK